MPLLQINYWEVVGAHVSWSELPKTRGCDPLRRPELKSDVHLWREWNLTAVTGRECADLIWAKSGVIPPREWTRLVWFTRGKSCSQTDVGWFPVSIFIGRIYYPWVARMTNEISSDKAITSQFRVPGYTHKDTDILAKYLCSLGWHVVKIHILIML